MDTLFRVEMLGRFVARQGSREISRFRTQKTASLLACLALNRSRAHPRDVLIEQFWPDSALKAARSNLSVALNALRGQLEPPGIAAGSVLIADHMQIRLNPLAFTTDVEEFQTALRAADVAADAAARLAYRIAALELYRGDLLPGSSEDWAQTERERLRDVYRMALRQTVQDCSERGQAERAIAYARQWARADALSEDAHCALIRLLLAAGCPQEAKRQYQELERVLQTELHTTPSENARKLAERFHDVSAAPPAVREASPGESASGEKTVSAPSLTAEKSRPVYRIPHPFTRFFGREEELARLTEWLRAAADPDAGRLVTLTGVGGTGKTRLSVEAAGRVREAFPGGVWFVPLAERDDPVRLGDTLRDALDLPRRTRLSALNQAIAFLRGRDGPTLLILDNAEQITGSVAPLVGTLLMRVPGLRCLVTSRQPLSLPGEREIPVSPLPVPMGNPRETIVGRDARPDTPGELLTCPGVALFVDRAQTVRPEFQITPRNAAAIASLCQKLEGIPLAIELAAVRARALTPSQMLERLTERFELLASRRAEKSERHCPVRAAIDWSYHLLSPELQNLFAQLSVFRGGWTLEAAAAVVGEEGWSVVGGPWWVGEGGRWSEDSGQWSVVGGRWFEDGALPDNRYPPHRPATQRVPGTDHRPPTTDHPSSPTTRPPSPTHHRLLPLDALTLLRGHSLIEAEESSSTIRFGMRKSLREFAEAQLSPEERGERERRHAAYFHQWVTGAVQSGAEQLTWFSRFEEDLDNLRVALDHFYRTDTGMFLQLANALERFWSARGYAAEGRRYRSYTALKGNGPYSL